MKGPGNLVMGLAIVICFIRPDEVEARGWKRRMEPKRVRRSMIVQNATHPGSS